MKLNLDRAFTGILVLAAVIVAVSAAKSSFSAPIRPEDVPPDFVSQWRDGLAAGHLAAGSPAARVTILGIVDLQCPICGAVHPLLQQVVAAHHGEVRLVYVPNPLPYHRSAMPAALGAQCAQRQGRFAAWVDTIFASQQLLGTRSWQAYATAAGV
jgi:protein-disulfide isomerase